MRNKDIKGRKRTEDYKLGYVIGKIRGNNEGYKRGYSVGYTLGVKKFMRLSLKDNEVLIRGALRKGKLKRLIKSR